MAFTHGIYTNEQATSISAPITTSAGLTVVIGAAPIHKAAGNPDKLKNIPVIVRSFDDFEETFGYDEDFKTYGLCAAADYYFRVRGVGPLICINVYDGGYTTEEVSTFTASTVSAAAEEGSVWVTDESGKALKEGTDYTVAYNAANFAVTAKGDASGKQVTIHYHVKDTAVTIDKSAIITGISAVKKVYPALGEVPGILIAPYFSQIPEVSAAMLAVSHDLNGSWEVMDYVDIDSSSDGAEESSAVKTKKEAQGLTDPNQFAVWGYGMVGEKAYPGSIIAAAQSGYTDSENEDVPYNSPSNKATPLTGICTASGKSLYIDQEEANAVNALGVATILNHGGYRLWGNRTCAYPSVTDVKDVFISVRRMFNWRRNNFIATFFQKVDDPANYRLIESIVDSYNVTGNYYVNQGYCAIDQMSFSIDENPVTELLNGVIKFHSTFSPFTPAETIKTTFEFDPNALSTALGGE